MQKLQIETSKILTIKIDDDTLRKLIGITKMDDTTIVLGNVWTHLTILQLLFDKITNKVIKYQLKVGIKLLKKHLIDYIELIYNPFD